MEQQLEEVTSWLKTIYGNQPVPEFEVNAETVDVLHKLAEYSKARDRDMALLIEDTKQRATEHEDKAKYLQDLLTEHLGPFPFGLSREGTSCLDILVSCAMLLETNNTSLSSLFSAINDRTLELYEVESENREKELELTELKNKLTPVVLMEMKLKEDLKTWEELLQVEKDAWGIQLENLNFLREKNDLLKTRIEAVEGMLASTGFNQSLTHESLVKLSEKLAGLREEIVPLKQQLKSYLDLSPNAHLAQVKIEEVKRELNAVEEQLSKEVNKMMGEFPAVGKHFT